MLAVPTNDVSEPKYFVHLIRTSLSKSGTNFEPIRNVQYFGLKTGHELLEFRENIKMLAVPKNNISHQKYFVTV